MTSCLKFHESHFDDYVSAVKRFNLHPKNEKLYKKFPKRVQDLKNIIFFGPAGTGKYSQALYSIRNYSQSELKYEKKISITFNKQIYFIKISDIHFEVDMSLLGCNSKLLWHDIFMQILDIISTKSEKNGIIICKNFHEIHSELLDNFYSYMQKNSSTNVDIKFILVTEQISFLPDNILNCCEIISVQRPSKINYNKCLNSSNVQNIQNTTVKKISNKFGLDNITNIKDLYSNENISINNEQHKNVCDKIIENMRNVDLMNYSNFRDVIYDIFIYNLNVNECIWYILVKCVEEMSEMKKMNSEKLSKILIETFLFFQYYNNNYRPIYHLENYFLKLTNLMHYVM